MTKRRIGVQVLACVCVLAASACGGREPRTAAHAGRSTTVTNVTPVTHSRVSARIVLPSGVIVAGSTALGTLVIENNTRGPVRLKARGAPGCTPQWGVVLTNQKVPQQGSFSAECGVLPLVLRTGETRLPFSLDATFAACSSTGEPEGSLMPVCLPGPGGVNVAPPLPDDLYEARFYTDAVGFPDVISVPVRVASPA